MTLIEQLEQDTVTAMKARDQMRLDTLRMLRAALKNEQIAIGHELAEAEVLKILNRQIKQRREAADHYRVGGRTEAALKEETEARLIKTYLPAKLSDEELLAIITEVVQTIGASGSADFGKIMGPVMTKIAGRADGDRVAKLVKSQFG